MIRTRAMIGMIAGLGLMSALAAPAWAEIGTGPDNTIGGSNASAEAVTGRSGPRTGSETAGFPVVGAE